jgi:hypothetical protein
MEYLDFLLPGQTAAPKASPICESRLVHAAQGHNRRIDDAIEEVFYRACAGDNVRLAADLLAMLEKQRGTRVGHYGAERRVNDTHIKAMRAELRRRRAHAIQETTPARYPAAGPTGAMTVRPRRLTLAIASAWSSG